MRKFRRSASEYDSDKSIPAPERRLLRAVDKGNINEVKECLTKPNINIVVFGPQGTPLHYAALHGFVTIANLLLDKGSPPNMMGETNYSPLHLAARYGHQMLVDLLIKHGAKLNIESKWERRTPLHLAARQDYVSVLNSLVDANADLDHGDIYGTTALHVASRAGYLTSVELLISSGTDVSKADKYGWTALHLASEGGHVEIILLLLDKGAYIDAQNRYGRTPLHWACESEQSRAVEILLSRGADPNIKDTNGRTPTKCAHRNPVVLHHLSLHDACDTSDSDKLPNFMQKDSIGQLLQLTPILGSFDSVDGEPDALMIPRARGRSGSIAFNLDPLKPLIEDVDIYDSGIDVNWPVHANIGEDIKMANTKYRSLMRTVSGLLIVMESKTETLSDIIAKVLDGKDTKSYADSLREIFTFLQTLMNSLGDFRLEITTESSEMTRILNAFMRKCISSMEELALRNESFDEHRLIHFVSTALAKHPGSWRTLHGQLMVSHPPQKCRAFRDAIEEDFESENDQAFQAMHTWMTEEVTDKSQVKNLLVDALTNCTFDDPVVIEDVKNAMEKSKKRPEKPRKKTVHIIETIIEETDISDSNC